MIFKFLNDFSLNAFVLSALFLHLLKTSENTKVFWYFQGVEKSFIGNKYINSSGQ